LPQLTTKQKKREKNSEARKALKDKVKLDPEVVFYEGPPHWSEVVVPAISILTVIGTSHRVASLCYVHT
jgi:hypothetical protein